MKIKAQMSMVMNLDKCIGCHTCSITCKNAWTNRPGAEYMYFNNVETKPGIGYPKHWEDQDKWRGGWMLDEKGELVLRSGSKGNRLLKLFYHPDQPELDDYYEPWTYDYETLIHSKRKNNQPIARPRSLITQERMEIHWGPNWEDDLAGATARADYHLQKLSEKITMEFRDIFMKYLPRNCNHCLNPACVAACPSGAMYKRDEDGVVLVSQDVCRGWRHCVPSCPYKKVYYNWETNKAEKCTFCYPRLENGLSQICADTCVGRIRYAGVLLYDMDKVGQVAATKDPKEIYHHVLDLILDPHDPAVEAEALAQGVPESYVHAAKLSPIYRIVKEWKLGLPLHPEYRTLPMVWYIPPLSPIVKQRVSEVYLPDTDEMRIPLEYLAALFAAGNVAVIRDVLQRLIDMRLYMKHHQVNEPYNIVSDLTPEDIHDMYRLLAIAKVRDRFVVPTMQEGSNEERHAEQGGLGFVCKGGCGS